ncbi:heavy-metal-associated domain-containing protein [Candidatus Woesearchaeota archaeon]|nr:MAG: heavy-metal-associated domain-containing protein [Candidatus Woesearchaeota archaeon]
MKKHVFAGLSVLAALLVMAAFAFNTNHEDNAKDLINQQSLETAYLQIEGMTCKSCALGVEYELKQVNGVVDARVSYKEGTGIVTFNPEIVDAETIAKASTVYPARVIPQKN